MLTSSVTAAATVTVFHTPATTHPLSDSAPRAERLFPTAERVASPEVR